MLTKVLETIQKNSMLKAGDKVVCALSGGADSMALLCALYEMKDSLGIEVYAAHLNHCIRGEEADGDALFVKKFCEEKGIKLFCRAVDIPLLAKEKHISCEEAGREERYKLFEDVSHELGGAKIATGHHKNDNAETVLFHLLRGSGGRGMRGIPYKRGNIIRPMLDIKHEDAINYLKENGILWREDSTNNECKYVRNKLRLVILKEMQKIFPDAVNKIVSASRAIGTDDEYLTSLAEKSGAFEEGKIFAEKFIPLHESLRRRVVIKALEAWGVKNIDTEKIRAVYETVINGTGKGRDLGDNIRVVNSYGTVFKETESVFLKKTEQIDIKLGENLEITAFGGVWSIKTVDKTKKMRDNKMMIFLDADKIGGEVSVRCRKDGDFISPQGMIGTKKLKKVFIDLKIPKENRDKISMLAYKNEILFIPGIRKTKNYLPDENTKSFLVAEYKG